MSNSLGKIQPSTYQEKCVAFFLLGQKIQYTQTNACSGPFFAGSRMSVDLETHQHVLRLWLHLCCGGGICGEEEDRPRRIVTDYVLTRKKDTKSDLFICWYFYWFALLYSTTSVDCNNTTKIKTREIQNCVCSCQSFDFFKKTEAVFRRQNLSRVSFSLLPLSRSLNYPERGGGETE